MEIIMDKVWPKDYIVYMHTNTPKSNPPTTKGGTINRVIHTAAILTILYTGIFGSAIAMPTTRPQPTRHQITTTDSE